MQDFFYQFGLRQLGPVFTAYIDWAAQSSATGTTPVFCVMREGQLLHKMWHARGHGRQATANEIWLSRFACLAAALAPDDHTMMQNFLWRARPERVSIGEILQQLELQNYADECPWPLVRLVDAENAPAFEAWLWQGKHGATLRDHVAARRQGLLRYLEKIGALANERLLLLDLGYAGNIQHALQLVLKSAGQRIVTHGLYLVATRGIGWAEQAGCVIKGFLLDHGLPENFVGKFLPLRHWIELCVTSTDGTLLAYGVDGTLINARPPFVPQQYQEIAALQAGMLAYAAQSDTVPDAEAARDLIAALHDRAIQKYFQHWHYDENFGTAHTRPLLTT